MSLRVGDQGEEVKKLQQLLVQNGYSVSIDGDFGAKTELAVVSFQMSHRLYADGIVGPITMQALGSPPPALAKPTLKFVKIDCDKYKDGYSSTNLREDAAAAYQKVVDELHSYGAVATSSGGKRELSASVGSNRSKTSFHYTGLAHDLYVYSGMVNPKTDPYVLTKAVAPNKWVLWARCKTGGQTLTLNGYTYKHKEVSTTGNFVNATAIFNKHGFSEISSRSTFINGRDDLGAEWWHFQWDKNLIKNQSTFGEELLKIYSISTLEKYALWGYKDYVFGVNWF